MFAVSACARVVGGDGSDGTKNASVVWVTGNVVLVHFIVRSVLSVYGFTTKYLSVFLVRCL